MPGLRGDMVTVMRRFQPDACKINIKPRMFSEGSSPRDGAGSLVRLKKDEFDLKRLKKDEFDLKRLKKAEGKEECSALLEVNSKEHSRSHAQGEETPLSKRERVTLKLIRRDLTRLGLMFTRAKKVEEKVEAKVGKQNTEGLVEEINNYIWEQAVDLLDKPIAHSAVKLFHQSLTMLEKLQAPMYSLANRISHLKQFSYLMNQPKLVTIGIDKLHHFLLDGSLLNVLTHLFHR